MNRLVRVLGALLIGASSLVLVAPAAEAAPAAPAAPGVPSYACPPTMSKRTCATAQTVEVAFTAMKALGMIDGTFTAFLDSIGGLESLGGLGSGGEIECGDVGLICGEQLEQEREALARFTDVAREVAHQLAVDEAKRTKFESKSLAERKYACDNGLSEDWLCVPFYAELNEGVGTTPPANVAYAGDISGYVGAPMLGGGGGQSFVFALPVASYGPAYQTVIAAVSHNDTFYDASIRVAMADDPAGSGGTLVAIQAYGRGDYMSGEHRTAFAPDFTFVTPADASTARVGLRWVQADEGWRICALDATGPTCEFRSSNPYLYEEGGLIAWTTRSAPGAGLMEMYGGGGLVDDLALTSRVQGIGAPAPEVPPLYVDPWEERPPRPSYRPSPSPSTSPAPALPPIPAPAPNPTVTPQADDEKGWLETLGNRIGGFLDTLGSAITSALSTLGDIFGYWIRWLAEGIQTLVVWLRNELVDAIEFVADTVQAVGVLIQSSYQVGVKITGALLREVVDAVESVSTTVARSVGDVVDELVGLPRKIGEAVASGLSAFFVPSGSLDLGFNLPACSETFPCSWIDEGISAGQAIPALIGGTSDCQTPSFGFPSAGERPGFEASLPAPSGCGGGNGAAIDGNTGDLMGMREPLRALGVVVLWFGVARKLLGNLPWGRSNDLPVGV